MKGRRTPSRSKDAETRRAVQASMARKKRLPTLPSAEPAAPPADAPKPAAEALPAGQTVGTMDVTEAYRAARRMALYEQPPQPLPLLWPGVQDEPAAVAGESPPAAVTGMGGDVNIPATAGLAEIGAKGEGATPDAGVLEEAKAKDEVTAEYVPAQVAQLSGTISTRSGGGAHLALNSTPQPEEGTLAVSAEQRPAAYRFGLRDGKIDVLPEHPEPEDREFALDTYHELVAKVRELHERLKGTNSARRVCDSIERLLAALGASFVDLRLGVLLSRERSIAADRAAFGNDDARGELFPDAIAMMDDTLRTLRDLMAAFPIVRRIEAERLALDLDRNADAVPIIQQQMLAIQAVAVQSGAVTQYAIGALAQNDPDIEDAPDPVVRRSLIGDKLLVFHNFVGAVIGGIASYRRMALAKAGPELGGLGRDIWKEIRARVPKGVGLAVTVAPLFLLADQISDPYLRIGAAVPALTPIAMVLKNAIRDALKDAATGEAKNNPKGKRQRKSR